MHSSVKKPYSAARLAFATSVSISVVASACARKSSPPNTPLDAHTVARCSRPGGKLRRRTQPKAA